MLFNTLESATIKQGVISRLAFSLGFKLINSTIQAKREQTFKPLNFDTGELDYSKQQQAEICKRNWAEFKTYCETNSYTIDTLEVIAQAYTKGKGKQATNVNNDVVALRARVTGLSIATLKDKADQARVKAIAKAEEQTKHIVAELSDVTTYANAWYHTCHVDDFGGLASSSVEIRDILTDEFIVTTYPKVLKNQCEYWQKWNNWDDAELVLISSDQLTLAQCKA
jgi:hypothetical protein